RRSRAFSTVGWLRYWSIRFSIASSPQIDVHYDQFGLVRFAVRSCTRLIPLCLGLSRLCSLNDSGAPAGSSPRHGTRSQRLFLRSAGFENSGRGAFNRRPVAAFAVPTGSPTARENSPAAERASASCPQSSRSGATGVRPATLRSPAAPDRRFPVSSVPGPRRCLAYGEIRYATLRAAACSGVPISCILGPICVGHSSGWRVPAVWLHTGAGSAFAVRAMEGERPVQRLKAWLNEDVPW